MNYGLSKGIVPDYLGCLALKVILDVLLLSKAPSRNSCGAFVSLSCIQLQLGCEHGVAELQGPWSRVLTKLTWVSAVSSRVVLLKA